MRKCRNWVFGIVFVLFLGILVPLTCKAEENGQVVKVGFMNFPGLSQIEADGTCTGYFYDYLMMIGGYQKWNYEFISITPEESIDKLMDGSIDMIGGIVKNEDTEKIMDFPEFPSGYSYTTLCTSLDNPQYSSQDYSSLDGMRVGVLQSATKRKAHLKEFCNLNGIQVEVIEFDSEAEEKKALKAGEIDGYISSDLVLSNDTRVIAKFARTPYYFVVKEGRADLLSGLNYAMQKILIRDAGYDQKLYQKYFTEPEYSQIYISDQEWKYISKVKTLKVSVLDDWAPIIYKDKSSDSYKGLAIDILNRVSDVTGLRFEYVRAADFTEAMEQVRKKKTDLIAGLMLNFDAGSQQNITTTFPYLIVQYMLVTREKTDISDLSMLKAAVVRGAPSTNIIDSENVIYYDNITDCLNGIKSGQADYTFCNSYTAEVKLRQGAARNLIISAVPNYELEVCFGMSNGQDGNLTDILEKTAESYSSEDIRTLVIQHMMELGAEQGFADFIYRYPLQAVGIVSLMMLVLAGLIISWMRIRIQIDRQAYNHAKSYRMLADTLGEIGFEYDCIKDELQFFGKKSSDFSVSLIPHFRDKLGKGKVPTTLTSQQLTQIMKQNQREEEDELEFQCQVQDGKMVWYRMIYTILYSKEAHPKPVKLIGCLENKNAEHQEKERLLDMSRYDNLTGLLNRRGAQKEITEAMYQENTGTMVMIDIDHFKSFNDRYGHLVGDEVLRVVGIRMKEAFGANPIICRWGGDEFLVFVRVLKSHEELQKQVECLRNGMMDTSVNQLPCPVYLSIGSSDVEQGDDLIEVFRRADAALYQVKENGRNGYVHMNTTNI